MKSTGNTDGGAPRAEVELDNVELRARRCHARSWRRAKGYHLQMFQSFDPQNDFGKSAAQYALKMLQQFVQHVSAYVCVNRNF